MPLSDPMSDVCVVWTVVEQELHISTCFLSSTVATIDGYTTSVPGPTCIDTTVTESKTINAPTEALNTAAAAADFTVYETFTTDVYTTVCPSPTTFTYQDKTHTVTEPGGTIVTITGKLPTAWFFHLANTKQIALADIPVQFLLKHQSPSSTLQLQQVCRTLPAFCQSLAGPFYRY